MRRALLFLVAALALMVVPLGAAETTYTDPTGDAGIGPDITSVAVSNSDAGLITIGVTAAPIPEWILWAALDTDLNQTTGSDGVDRVVIVALSGSGVVLTAVGDPVTGDLSFDVPVTATSASGVVAVSFQKEVLNVNEAFSFWLATTNMESDEILFADEAPNAGFWTYVLTKPAPPPPPVKPMIGKPVTAGAPIAGKKFTVSFAVTRSDDGSLLTTGTADCKTTVAGKTVPHTHSFKSGTVKAVVAVPKAAKGKQLRIAVKVTADTAATKVFTFKVK